MRSKDEIINKLREMFDDEDTLNAWLSTPNKNFRNRPPIDLLESGNFDYFISYFGTK